MHTPLRTHAEFTQASSNLLDSACFGYKSLMSAYFDFAAEIQTQMKKLLLQKISDVELTYTAICKEHKCCEL
jgi:hypothetical protein